MQVGSTSNCLNLEGLTHIPPVWISKDVGSKVKVRWTKRTEEFQISNLYNIMSVLKIKVVAPPLLPPIPVWPVFTLRYRLIQCYSHS